MSAEVDKAYERLQRCTIDDCNMILTWTSLEPVNKGFNMGGRIIDLDIERGRVT